MSTSEGSPQIEGILWKYYGLVKNLQSYLADIIEITKDDQSVEDLLFQDAGSPGYCEFLKSSFIGVKDPKPIQKLKLASPLLDMRDILDSAQVRLFKAKRPNNVITSGYRLAHANDNAIGKRGIARMGITNYFLNTVITAFQAPEWETLLLKVGEDVMIHLLSETSIFMPLPNGCLCQLAGEPLIYASPKLQDTSTKSNSGPNTSRKRPNDVDPQSDRPAKRPRLETSNRTAGPQRKVPGRVVPPVDISFVRFRMFYSRPNYIPDTKHILVGLPSKHILNKIYPSYLWHSKVKPKEQIDLDDPRQNAERARRLSKYVFARQYGLKSPFHSAGASAFGYGDYLDREAEIKAAGPCKTPKRLKEVLPILEKMIRRHSRCGYVPLRDRVCPSKVAQIKSTASKDLDPSVILELISEDSIQLRSQISYGLGSTSLDSTGKPLQPMGLTQAQKYAKQKPRFAEFACTHVEVFRYVALITQCVIPKTFWGSRNNLKVVLRYVKEFISCRRYETLNLHYVLQNFSTAACDWLHPPGPGAKRQLRVSVTDALKRRELLEDFLFWYFDSFVLHLIKTTFYVTDSSAFRNQVLYFRHDDWTTLCAPLIERLTSGTFQRITEDEANRILQQRKLGFSFVRLLPKETGVRPIVNLRRRKAGVQGGAEQSINQILQAAFSILTYERNNQPKLLGASIFSPDDIYFKLKKLKSSLPRDENGALPKLYFVKLDVQACFDKIEQTKLLQILRHIISEDVYMMQKYGEIRKSADKVKRTYVKKAVPEDDHPHFLRYASSLAGALRNIIFVDQVVYPSSRKQEVLQLLEEHITENIVKIGSDYFRQTVGIPQGSVLSTILCSFFYGDLEKKFAKFMNDPQSILLRLTDDYLYITTNLLLAQGFLNTMKQGHPEYGCFISQEKTLTNFEHGDYMLNVLDPNQKTFPWCGFSIGMRDLSITVDYTRYQNTEISNTLTIDRGRRSGAAFMYKLLQMAKAKSHAIYSDPELNSKHTIYLNIYQNLLLTAIKTREYIRDWDAGVKSNGKFLRNAIQRAIVFSYTTVRMNARRKGDQKPGVGPEIHKEAVIWLGNHAFHYIFSRAPQKHTSLISWLVSEMKRVKSRRYEHRFKAVVTEGQQGLDRIIGRA